MKHFNRTVTVLVFIFLYVPIIVLAVASFNEGLDIATFKGFTFRQYANLFRDETLLTLLRNSLIIAILSSLIATFFGTMAAVGIHSMKGRMRKAVMTLTNIPMTNPDIVTGVALALLFAFTGMMLKINSILGFWTLLVINYQYFHLESSTVTSSLRPSNVASPIPSTSISCSGAENRPYSAR